MIDKFTHLHLHTEHSYLDGLGTAEEYADLCHKYNMKSCAITDHGYVGGIPKFIRVMKEAGIKPIPGLEAYLVSDNTQRGLTTEEKKRLISEGRTKEEISILSKKRRFRYHLLLLAKNAHGLRNINEIATSAALNGYYYVPRIDFKSLLGKTDGIICTTTCILGPVPQFLLKNKIEKAKKILMRLIKLFGKENIYIEIEPANLDCQKEANEKLIKISKEFNLPLVATNDVHYAKEDQAKLHEILLLVQQNSRGGDKARTIDSDDRFRFSTPEYWFRSSQEMANAFSTSHSHLSQIDWEQAIENTGKISDQCSGEILKPSEILPSVNIDGIDGEIWIEKLVRKTLKDKGLHKESQYVNRLEEELHLLKQKGFLRYIAIVAESIQWAKKHNIRTGPRGSAAGSLVCWLSGISMLDPIQHELPVWRFLAPWRKDWPDIDVDVQDDRRDEIKQHLADIYGEDKVADVGNHVRFRSRLVFTDVARAFGIPFLDVKRLSEHIPLPPQGEISPSKILQPFFEEDTEAKAWVSRNPIHAEVAKHASDLELRVKYYTTHAAGVVISGEPLASRVGLLKDPKRNSKIVQANKDDIEAIGLIKFDLLGLASLGVIEKVLQHIKESGIEKPDLNNLSLNCSQTFADLNKWPVAIFQLETPSAQELIKRFPINSFKDLIVFIAINRPGPLAAHVDRLYIQRKKRPSKIKYIHPIIEKILGKTYGLIIFQEQLMLICHDLCGMTMEEADEIRRIVAKKKGEQLLHWKQKFIEGAIATSKISREDATQIFEDLKGWGSYAFNMSHSASYAYTGYIMAYLKSHYPEQFYSGALTYYSGMRNEERKGFKEQTIRALWREAKIRGFKLLPPNINQSKLDVWSPSKRTILFGWAPIKGLSSQIKDQIHQYAPYKDLIDLIDKTNITSKDLEILAGIGALDDLVGDAWDSVRMDAKKWTIWKRSKRIKPPPPLFSRLPDDEKEFLRSKIQDEFLMVSFGDHPTTSVTNKLIKQKGYYAIADIDKAKTGRLIFHGLIRDIKPRSIKENGKMKKWYKIIIEDETGRIDVTIPEHSISSSSGLRKKQHIIILATKSVMGKPNCWFTADASDLKNKSSLLYNLLEPLHPVISLRKEFSLKTNIQDIKNGKFDKFGSIRVIGLVVGSRRIVKESWTATFIELEDETGTISFPIFEPYRSPGLYDLIQISLSSYKGKPSYRGGIIIKYGTLWNFNDIIFKIRKAMGNKLLKQENKI